MNHPAISVIIPVYNQEKYLGKCIHSVLGQSFQDFEVILVNDGSTDKSLQICQKYANKDSRVTIIDKQNERQALARRDGLLKAKGEYVCFLDSDDYLATDALGTLYKLAEEYHVDAVIGNYDRVFDNWCLVKLKSHSYQEADKLLSKEEIVPFFLARGNGYDLAAFVVYLRLYRRTCILKALEESSIPLFPLHCVVEDSWFNLVIAPFLKSVRVSDIIVYHYRYGGGTSRYFPRVRKSSSFYEHSFDYCIRYGCESLLPSHIRYYSLCLLKDVIGQIHFHAYSEKEIRVFLQHEMEEQKIVLWAQSYPDKLPDGMKQDSLLQSLINKDVDGFLAIANMRERYRRKHYYWKLKIVSCYQKAADNISCLFSMV